MSDCSVDWLIEWVSDWLIGRLIDWTSDWWIEKSIDWLIDWMKTRRVFFHFFSKVDAGELFFACFSFYRILKNELLEMARQAAKLRENLRNKENAIMLLTEQVTRQEERAAASRPARNGSQRSLPDTEDQVQKMRVRLIIFRAPTLNGIEWHWMASNGIGSLWHDVNTVLSRYVESL